jgi:acetyl-CoA carboxylase carboxyl transferase subunit beta
MQLKRIDRYLNLCASGGARMQEGILSLMQMAKFLPRHVHQSCANLLYISVLNITYNRRCNSKFRNVRDLIFAEPKAVIGFAGRVIEQNY